MFKHREKQPFLKKLRNWIWPEPGLKRTLSYHRHRIARIPDTPYRIAAGFAAGSAVSFTPFIGFHILIGLFVAFLIRANYLATALGTIIGNPWTFPFIWVLIYNTGMWILGRENDGDFMSKVDGNLIFSQPFVALEPVLFPMFIGGIPITLMAFWVTFWPVKAIIQQYRVLKKIRTLSRKEERLKGFDKIIEDYQSEENDNE